MTASYTFAPLCAPASAPMPAWLAHAIPRSARIAPGIDAPTACARCAYGANRCVGDAGDACVAAAGAP